MLGLFDLTADDLDPRFAPRLAYAGVQHAIYMLRDRNKLAQMAYPFEEMRVAMLARDLVTVSLLVADGPHEFASRNAFASGGVVEDPATGAAAAALGGALVDVNWDGLGAGGQFTVVQGEDMGAPSQLTIDVTGEIGASVRVTGEVRWMS